MSNPNSLQNIDEIRPQTPTEPAVGELPAELTPDSQQPLQPELERNHPRWRRWIGTVMLAAGITTGVVSGAIGESAERAYAAPAAHAEATIGREISAQPGSIQEQYEQADVKVSNKPFDYTVNSINVINENELVKPVLDKYEAVFKVGVKLSSGIKINFYTSKLDKKSEPKKIDYKALDVLMNQVLKTAGEIEENPAASQFAELQRQAKKGQLDLVWNVITISDEKLCLEDSKLPTNSPQIENSTDTSTCYSGVNYSRTEKNLSVTNQIAVVFDSGRYGPNFENQLPDYYEDQRAKPTKKLGPDQWMALTLAHEAGHALFRLTGLGGTITSDQEHEQFVNPLESKLYDNFLKLPKEFQKYITPVHVDSRKTSKVY